MTQEDGARGWSRTAWAAYGALARAFGLLGDWITTHQTLSLLATALVICSLLSPAILVTFSPSGSFLDISASAITRRGRGEFLWELEGMARQGLIYTEEEVCWDRVRAYYAKTGRERGGTRIRVEQILIPVGAVGASASSRATITKGALHRIWRLQTELERRLHEGLVPGNACVWDPKDPHAACAVVSPMAWWSDEAALLQDADVHKTLSTRPSAEPRGPLPVTLSNTFVGIGRDKQGLIKTAQQVILTFLLEEPAPEPALLATNATLRAEDHAAHRAAAAWRDAVHSLVAHRGWSSPFTATNSRDPIGIASESKAPTRHVILKYLPQLTVEAHPRLLENVIYGVGYVLVLVYVSRFVRKVRAHSKLGLLATGAVELVASGIMSVSICWLLGWSLSQVPWNLLAFLVLTSGLDNMIVVLRTIADTDVNLPVPRRMSAGLRRVGAEMTILLAVEELMALGLLWWVEISVMREWIRFGAVVLVVDYFLELTFFSTVLSIDIQRLELADLLAQNNAMPYKPLQAAPSAQSRKPREGSCWSTRSIARAVWKVLRDRPAKTSTVAFLWIINVFLFVSYGSEHYLPAACSQTALSPDRPFLAPALSPSFTRSLRLGQRPDSASSSTLEVSLGAAAAFWDLVNPKNSTSVQVYLEPPVSIQFLDDSALAAPESLDALLPHEHNPSLLARVAVVLLPIAVVMGLLQVLLIFLLKDAELLQAHWGSEERLGGSSRASRRRSSTFQAPVAELEAIPASGAALRHENDVELVASAADVLVSWAAMEPTVRVARLVGTAFQHSYDVELAGARLAPSLVRLDLDPTGSYLAGLDTAGSFVVWRLAADSATLLRSTDSGEVRSPVRSMAAQRDVRSRAPRPSLDARSPSPMVASPLPGMEAVFITSHEDGSVWRWQPEAAELTCQPVSMNQRPRPAGPYLVNRNAQALVDLDAEGGACVVRLSGQDASTGTPYTVRGSSDGVTATALLRADEEGSLDSGLLAVGRASGHLELHDLGGQHRVGRIDAFDSPIRRVEALVPSRKRTCTWCGSVLVGGGIIVASTRTAVKVFQAFEPPASADENCLCRAPPTTRSGPVSPTMSRVASMNAPYRRGSPRKKPTTPQRPPQPIFAAEASLRPPTLHAVRSSSSSGSTSPEQERPQRNSDADKLPPPPRSAPASPSASPSPSSIPLPLPAVGSLPDEAEEGEERRSSSSQLRLVEVASVTFGSRGRWTIIGDRLVGFRHTSATPVADLASAPAARGWEVWTLSLGLEGGGQLDADLAQAALPLGDLLATELPTELEVETALSSSREPTSSLSSLRRRRPSAAPPEPSTSSAVTPSPLPFSRARPVVPALGGQAVAAGLGNRVLLIRPASGGPRAAGTVLRDHQNGFLGI